MLREVSPVMRLHANELWPQVWVIDPIVVGLTDCIAQEPYVLVICRGLLGVTAWVTAWLCRRAPSMSQHNLDHIWVQVHSPITVPAKGHGHYPCRLCLLACGWVDIVLC